MLPSCKSLKLAYLNEKSSDFDAVCHTNVDFELDDSHMTKYGNF